jgi:hypothetical protein
MKAYKFTKRQFYDRGSFRLGTLYDYRREDNYGTAVGDAREGSFDRQHSFDFNTSSNLIGRLTANQEFSWMYAKGKRTSPQERHPFVLNFTSANLLIFSAALVDDDGLFNEFSGADCCLEICDFEAFCQALVSKIPRVQKWAIKECVYADRVVINDRAPMPSLPFLKDVRYAQQREIRLAVQLWGDPTDPVMLSSLDPLKYCRIHKP